MSAKYVRCTLFTDNVVTSSHLECVRNFSSNIAHCSNNTALEDIHHSFTYTSAPLHTHIHNSPSCTHSYTCLTLLHGQFPLHWLEGIGETWMVCARGRKVQCRSMAFLQQSKSQCPPAGDWAAIQELSLLKKSDSDYEPAAESHWCHEGCGEILPLSLLWY